MTILLICVATLVLLQPTEARSGGIILYELGTSDVGRGSAGWAARADDASTLFTNPAGMARADAQGLLLGGQLTFGQFSFEPGSDNGVAGTGGGNPVGWIPGGSAFYTRALGERWSAGLGAFTYFGLAAEYDRDWVGRFYVQKSGLIGFTLMPAVSFRVNEKLSLGAGFNWMLGFFNQENAVSNALQQDDGSFKLDDDTQGFGGTAGLLFEASDHSRYGLTYVSQVSLDFGAVPEFAGLGAGLEAILDQAGILGAKIDLGVTVPHMVMASAYHRFSDSWAFMGNLGWQNWNAFGKTQVSIGEVLPATTADLEYDDTWHVAAGAEFDLNESWLCSAGAAFDSSPVDDASRALSIPMSETWRIGAGAQWAVSERVKLGGAYQLTWLGDMAIDQFREVGNQEVNRVQGTFTSTALHGFVLNFEWDL